MIAYQTKLKLVQNKTVTKMKQLRVKIVETFTAIQVKTCSKQKQTIKTIQQLKIYFEIWKIIKNRSWSKKMWNTVKVKFSISFCSKSRQK